MTKGDIRLHTKFGLNPTIPVCIWCGRDKNEIALLGASYKDQAPMHMVIDNIPCDICTANMALGITLVEVQGSPEYFEREPLGYMKTAGGWVKKTGRWWVITPEAATRMGITSPISLITEEDARKLGFYDPDVQPKEE